jgi:uncharacterized membrane protein affecting hemolysin expression
MQEEIISKGIIFNKIYLIHSVLVNQSNNSLNRPHNQLTDNNLMANSLIYQTHNAQYTVFTLVSL